MSRRLFVTSIVLVASTLGTSAYAQTTPAPVSTELGVVRVFPAIGRTPLAPSDRPGPLDAPGRRELLAGGLLFGVSFTATFVLGAFELGDPSGNSGTRTLGALSFVPVVGGGAWMGLGLARDPGVAMIFLADTIAQAVGIGLLVHGLWLGRTHWQHDDGHGRVEVAVVPSAPGSGAGATVIGCF